MTNQHSDNNSFIVVGIGASAGGLAPLSELLNHLPNDIDMAFVVVQHLDPDQTSLLDELLSRITQIPVNTAEDGMLVEPNHVYVIPPNAQMTISQGQLQLATCDQTRQRVKTIDLFLKSLAAERQNKAIAIILSGSNNDGSQGILAIRASEGITFAQTPNLAEFREMPSAAIATGQVDFILSPIEIAQELSNISRHPYLREPPAANQSIQQKEILFQEEDISKVFSLLRKNKGVDFSEYKQTTFRRRLRRRLILHQMSSLGEYIQYLQDHPSELQALYQDILITVTSFFRDPDVYLALKERVFPTLLQQRSAMSSIRIWVPGCSTGEEAYSIAICLLECLNSLLISPTIQIFGTDICDEAIEEARLGIYRESRMEGLSPEQCRRFFVEVNGGYQINKSVRELCVFARQDLSSDPPFSDIDLVSCRNVLIYFQPALQKRVLSIFHYGLKPTGFLILGSSESIGDTSELFEIFDAQTKIYVRRPVPTRLNFDFVSSQHYPREGTSQQRQGFQTSLNLSNLQQWADQIVLNRYAPVGVIVNAQLEILQFRGDTSAYLRPPLGQPSFNLLRMIRPNLLVEVRGAIEQAKEQNVAIKRQNLHLEDSGGEEIILEVIPFTVSIALERCFLVLFEHRSGNVSFKESTDDSEKNRDPKDMEAETECLKQELASIRQELLDTQTFLRLTIEEQESTNQQLIAANEEILSSNEELKSTNEELQTAKEEIQSANEELKTTNEELQRRNRESRRANDDLLNLINNVNIPILMLSRDLCIRRFTPLMRSIFNLIPSDIGRPISDIRFDIDISNLEELISEVFKTLNPVEQDVQDSQGHWYLLRIRPYRTIDNQIDGVVIVLVDIDNLKRTEQNLRNSQAQLEIELFAMNQVQTLSRQLFTSFDLNQALNQFLDIALAMNRTTMGYVQLYNPERDMLEIVASRGFNPDILEFFPNIPASDRVLSTGQQVVIENVQLDPVFEPYRQIAALAGFQALQSTPLVNRDGVLMGVLTTHFTQPYSPSEYQLRMLELYARQASEFIYLMEAQSEQRRLQERALAAQAANARKDEFLSMLSHELRTPLQGILSWIQLMERSQVNESEMHRAIAAIKNSALIQLRLVQDLLDVSSIMLGRFQINPQLNDLSELLHQAIALVQPQATGKNIQLETVLEQCPDRLNIDANRIEQVFFNLLSNAIKFTPTGGHITIRLTDSPSQVQVLVQDNGQGIPLDLLPYIFERFRQADPSNSQQEGGLGLGLFLVRSIMEAHGGTVEAESPGEGQGAIFTLTFPKVITSESVQTPVSTTSAREVSLQGIKILYVDNNEDCLFVHKTLFELLGATVITARSASEALEIITRDPHQDILISDIGLPGVNGYDLIRQIRALPPDQGGEIPAIALTGYASEHDFQAAIAAGFQLHLAKPIMFEDLVEAVSSQLS